MAMRFDYRRWQRLALPVFAVALFLLFAVLAPHLGHASHGARRWFSLGSGVTIEPSELVKLALCVYMAAWLTSKGDGVRDFKTCFAPFSMIVGMVALLIIKQPDLGTAIVVTSSMVAVYFVAGADPKHFLSVLAGSAGVVWLLAHGAGYRSGRLTAFLDPWRDPTGAGYHTIQALLALGSGGIFGQGLGNSAQKWALPAPDTDSILAVIGEELGLIGTVGVLLLFLVIAYRGVRISMLAPDRFGRLLAVGLTSWLTFQALLNFAVITSSVPFTGVPLPFVSYGGSSLILSMTAVGVLLNISQHATGEAFGPHRAPDRRRNGGPRVPRAGGPPAPSSRRVVVRPAHPVPDGEAGAGEPR
jgi:cell division protein FtsW